MVWLNAVISFWIALGEYPKVIDRISIVLGVFTFVIFYAKVDIYLLNTERLQVRKALLISVFIKSLFQFYPSVELTSGMISTTFGSWIFGKIAFFSAYLITITDGILLSLLVCLLVLLINFIINKIKAH